MSHPLCLLLGHRWTFPRPPRSEISAWASDRHVISTLLRGCMRPGCGRRERMNGQTGRWAEVREELE